MHENKIELPQPNDFRQPVLQQHNVVGSTVYLMDCVEGMKHYPDKYFDLAIVDPPYGIDAPKQAATPHQRKKGMNRLNSGAGKLKGRVLNNSDTEWDNETPSAEYFLELWRVSKERIIWGGNYFDLPPTRGIICWDKCQPWENFSQIEYAWTWLFAICMGCFWESNVKRRYVNGFKNELLFRF